MKKIKRQMLAAAIIYVLWIIVSIVWGADVLHIHKGLQQKIISIIVQVIFLAILWRLWRKLIAAAIKEQEEKNGGMNN